MINMNINETKGLKFGTAISGVQMRDIQATMRILIEGIEFGFPTEVLDDKIICKIPPLFDIVKTDLKEGQIVKARLDVKIADTILQPWADSIKLITPVTVEATITEEEDIKKEIKPTITTEVIEDIDIKIGKKVSKKKQVKTRMSKIFEAK